MFRGSPVDCSDNIKIKNGLLFVYKIACPKFLLVVCILTRSTGSSKYGTTRKILADTTQQNVSYDICI